MHTIFSSRISANILYLLNPLRTCATTEAVFMHKLVYPCFKMKGVGTRHPRMWALLCFCAKGISNTKPTRAAHTPTDHLLEHALFACEPVHSAVGRLMHREGVPGLVFVWEIGKHFGKPRFEDVAWRINSKQQTKRLSGFGEQ